MRAETETLKAAAVVFASAFALNFLWENAHSILYAAYMGGKITEWILIRAAFGDAVIILLIVWPFIIHKELRNRDWVIAAAGIVVAALIEVLALQSGRWSYNELMPAVPIVKIGITPLIQLGLLGYVSYKLGILAAEGNARKKSP